DAIVAPVLPDVDPLDPSDLVEQEGNISRINELTRPLSHLPENGDWLHLALEHPARRGRRGVRPFEDHHTVVVRVRDPDPWLAVEGRAKGDPDRFAGLGQRHSPERQALPCFGVYTLNPCALVDNPEGAVGLICRNGPGIHESARAVAQAAQRDLHRDRPALRRFAGAARNRRRGRRTSLSRHSLLGPSTSRPYITSLPPGALAVAGAKAWKAPRHKTDSADSQAPLPYARFDESGRNERIATERRARPNPS